MRTPEGFQPRLVLVDNAPAPEIAEASRSWQKPAWPLALVHEPQPGLSRARNRGLRGVRDGWVVFTDDDVRPEPDWLVRLASRMQDGKCDAIAGAVKLAPDLDRPWMNRRHRACLAATEGIETGWLKEMVGANMSFRRAVLEKVPGFDEELGAGALGFGEETLFSWQLEEAGFRRAVAPDSVVVHHFDPSRISAAFWRSAAEKSGRCRAWLAHHWKHETPGWLPLRRAMVAVKLARRRALSPAPQPPEAVPDWEMSLLAEQSFYRALEGERRRPRKYARRGLAPLPSSPGN